MRGPANFVPLARRQTVGAIALATTVLLIMACASSATAPAPQPAASAAQPAAAVAPAPSAAPAPLTKLNVVYNNQSDGMIPLWLPLDAGIFAKHGLDVELEFAQGTAATQAMVAGQYDVGNVSASAVLAANAQGADLRLVLALFTKSVYALVTSKDVTTPEQMRGKTFGISRFGDSSDTSTRLILRRMGLNPEQDVNIIQVGNSPERYTALVAGHIQGMITSPTDVVRARRDGFPVLADQAALDIDYAGSAIAMRPEFIRDQRDTARRFLTAVVEGIHYYKTHQTEAAAVAAKYLRFDDMEALQDAARVYATTLMPSKPYLNDANLRPILDEVAGSIPAVRQMPTERFVDQSLLQEIDASGFIDALYR
jgi:NitT/TauT family transport system substrate-binding protein